MPSEGHTGFIPLGHCCPELDHIYEYEGVLELVEKVTYLPFPLPNITRCFLIRMIAPPHGFIFQKV
jgi:hypothetical protein